MDLLGDVGRDRAFVLTSCKKRALYRKRPRGVACFYTKHGAMNRRSQVLRATMLWVFAAVVCTYARTWRVVLSETRSGVRAADAWFRDYL